MKLFYFLLLSLLCFYGNVLLANYPDNNTIEGKIKVYIDDEGIDFDYLREALNFVDFVTEPAVADVQIILVEETTGSGGANFSLWFTGKLKNIRDYTLNVSVQPDETEHEVRVALSNAIVKGLMPYLNESNVAESYRLSITELKENTVEAAADKWKNWMFKLSGWGGVNYQDNRNGYDYTLAFKADKITDNFKSENYIYLNKEILNLSSEGETAQKNYEYNYVSSKLVFSLGEKFSLGGAVYGYQNSYQNTRHFVSATLAAEYNFFPWDLSNEKIVSVAYLAGVQNYVFNEVTIRNKTSEFLPMHQLRMHAFAVQPWGDIEVYVIATQNIPEFNLYNLSFESEFSIRIAKGLSLDFLFGVEGIHNQVYIPAAYYSFDDVLLGNIDLPSSIDVSATLGITYRFGSIYNNVVNKRL